MSKSKRIQTTLRIDEDAISEFRQLSRSFNQMLERLNNAFAAQRQFTGNAAHELRTPLALMQAQLELFSAEHPDVQPETAEFLTLLREQTERLIQLTRTLLEMSNLRQVERNERIQLAHGKCEVMARYHVQTAYSRFKVRYEESRAQCGHYVLLLSSTRITL